MKKRNRAVKIQTSDGIDAAESQPAATREVGGYADGITAAIYADIDEVAKETVVEAPDFQVSELEGVDVPDFEAYGRKTTTPVEGGFMDPDDDGASEGSGFVAYGEPLSVDDQGEEFNELVAMEELLSGESDYGALPLPEVFNAYPPEVQRKIMEWTDRDVKARRDDESRRKDELVRAQIDRERRKQSLPAIVIVVSIVCGTLLGFLTGNPWFAVAFLIVPIAVIVANFASENIAKNRGERFRKPKQ